MVRAAIVGLGWWGRMLVNSVQGKSKDIQFVTAQTRTRAKVEDFCREKNITLVDDVDAILRDPAIDAVVYATPHSQHEEQVERTAAAGKHVFIEKPFALHAASAKKAIAAAEKAGIVLAVGFNRRFHPSMVEMRKRVHDGTLGEIASVIGEQTAMSSPFLPPDGWRADPSETPAGAMTGIGIHTVDTMIHLFGRVTEAYCVTTRRATANIDDTTSVTLRFANGVTGLFFCSLATAGNYRLAVYGSKGFAEISRPTLETFRLPVCPRSAAACSAEANPAPGDQRAGLRHGRGRAQRVCGVDSRQDAVSGAARRGAARRRGVRGNREVGRERQAGRGRVVTILCQRSKPNPSS